MPQPGMTLYQVCTDRPGEFPYEGDGKLYDDFQEAMARLTQVRAQGRPHAYMATVTWQRCAELPSGEPKPDSKVVPTGFRSHIN